MKLFITSKKWCRQNLSNSLQSINLHMICMYVFCLFGEDVSRQDLNSRPGFLRRGENLLWREDKPVAPGVS